MGQYKKPKRKQSLLPSSKRTGIGRGRPRLLRLVTELCSTKFGAMTFSSQAITRRQFSVSRPRAGDIAICGLRAANWCLEGILCRSHLELFAVNLAIGDQQMSLA